MTIYQLSSLYFTLSCLFFSNILSKFSNTSSFPYTVIRHTGGPMAELPYNIHNFKNNLVLLELPNNRIRSLDRLSGLNHVDTLNLTGNQLTELPHGTFNSKKDADLIITPFFFMATDIYLLVIRAPLNELN